MKNRIFIILSFVLITLTGCMTTKDTVKPIILVSGGTQAMIVGDTYVAPSIHVSDNVDDTVDVIISGDTLDITTPGSYTIFYDAVDKAGNSAEQKSFTVDVYLYEESMDITNGGFETGNLTGWTIKAVDGSFDAFNDLYVVSSANRKAGTYYFDGSKTDDDKVGALRSSNFVLGGTGWIHFRLGGGFDKDHLFLAVYKSSNDEMVAKFANSNAQKYGGNEFLVGYKFNLLTLTNTTLGETFYIKIVDTKLENWAIIKLDDIKTFNITEPTSNTYDLAINQMISN